MTPSVPKHVYIGHSPIDGAFAARLGSDLCNAGFQVSHILDSSFEECQKTRGPSALLLVISAATSRADAFETAVRTLEELEEKVELVSILLDKSHIPSLFRGRRGVDFTVAYSAGLGVLLNVLSAAPDIRRVENLSPDRTFLVTMATKSFGMAAYSALMHASIAACVVSLLVGKGDFRFMLQLIYVLSMGWLIACLSLLAILAVTSAVVSIAVSRLKRRAHYVTLCQSSIANRSSSCAIAQTPNPLFVSQRLRNSSPMTSEKNRVVVAGYELTFTIYNSQDYTIRVADISTKILKTSVRFRGESTHMLIIDQDKSLFEPFGPHDIGPRESALVRLCYRIARSHGDIIAFVPVVMCTGPGGILDTIRSDFVCFCLDEGEVQLVRNKDAVSHDDPEVEEFIDEATQSFFATR